MATVYGLDASFDKMKDRNGIRGKAGDVNNTKTDEIFRWIPNGCYSGKYNHVFLEQQKYIRWTPTVGSIKLHTKKNILFKVIDTILIKNIFGVLFLNIHKIWKLLKIKFV
jgi:hypothetical protein